MLRWAATLWRVVGLALGVAVGLAVLGIGGRRSHLRELIVDRAPDAGEDLIGTATTAVLVGGLVTWAVLAILALVLARSLRRPRALPRWWAVPLLVLLVLVVGLTAVPLTDDRGLGLAARLSLDAAALLAVVATVLGLLPASGRWVREHRDRRGSRPGSAPRPGPAPASGER